MERNKTTLKIEEGRISYIITSSDGFGYVLAMQKPHCAVKFGKHKIESEMVILHDIYVTNIGGLYVCTIDGKIEKKISIPAEFVHAKYYQSKHFFDSIQPVQEKICAGTLVTEEPELASLIDLHAMRLINELIEDIANDKQISETIDNKLSLTIQNATDNSAFLAEAGRQFDLMKADDDEWLSINLNSHSYYLDPRAIQDNDTLYCLAVSKRHNYIIFTKILPFEFKATTCHLYISQDDGLGRYKIQKRDDIITQFFVPVDFVTYMHDRCKQSIDELKEVQDSTSLDVYHRQTMWNKLHDNVIRLTDNTLTYTENKLKHQIDESLHRSTALIPMSDVNSFDDFYNEVFEIEKGMRLRFTAQTHPLKLYVMNKHSNTSSVIFLKNLVNDVFSMREKIRILVTMHDSDYYVVVGEAWRPKSDKIQQRISKNYQRGDIARLPNEEREEHLIFYAKTKNTITREPAKSEVFKIIRERPNDEKSRILELRKESNDNPVNMEVEFPGFT